MENKPKRPILIAVIQYVLLFLALTNALSLVVFGLGFLRQIQNNRSIVDLFSLVLSVVGIILFVTAASRIAGKKSHARSLAIASFLLLLIRGVITIFTVKSLADPNFSTIGRSVLLFIFYGQMIFFICAAAYLLFSPKVIYYFHPDREPVLSDPPPPPSFDSDGK